MSIDTEYFCAVAFCHVTVANVTGKKNGNSTEIIIHILRLFKYKMKWHILLSKAVFKLKNYVQNINIIHK